MPRQRNSNSEDLLRQRRAQDQKMWSDMLTMINKATPQTMLGFGLGKLLRGAWDHYRNRQTEKADLDGKTIEARPNNSAYTIAGLDPRTATFDTANSYYGIAPQKGLLGKEFNVKRDFMESNPGNIISWGQNQTKQEVTQPNGKTETVTTTSPSYTIGGSVPFAQQVQQAAENINSIANLENMLYRLR
jgi:hypothetical protein